MGRGGAHGFVVVGGGTMRMGAGTMTMMPRVKQIRKPPVPYLVVQSEEDAQQQAELYDVEHDYVEQAPVIDVLRELIGLEKVQPNLSDHIDHVYDLVPLTPELNICLLR